VQTDDLKEGKSPAKEKPGEFILLSFSAYSVICVTDINYYYYYYYYMIYIAPISRIESEALLLMLLLSILSSLLLRYYLTNLEAVPGGIRSASDCI